MKAMRLLILIMTIMLHSQTAECWGFFSLILSTQNNTFFPHWGILHMNQFLNICTKWFQCYKKMFHCYHSSCEKCSLLCGILNCMVNFNDIRKKEGPYKLSLNSEIHLAVLLFRTFIGKRAEQTFLFVCLLST